MTVAFLNSAEAACFSSLACLIAEEAADFSEGVAAFSSSNLALFSFLRATASFLRAFYFAMVDGFSTGLDFKDLVR